MAKLKHKTYHTTNNLAKRLAWRERKLEKLKMLEALLSEQERQQNKDREYIRDLHHRIHCLRTQIKVQSVAL